MSINLSCAQTLNNEILAVPYHGFFKILSVRRNKRSRSVWVKTKNEGLFAVRKYAPYMYQSGSTITPGQWMFGVSSSLWAIVEPEAAGLAVVGWAVNCDPDRRLSKTLAALPYYETLKQLKLHNKYGNTDQYDKLHLCLNDKQLVALLSTRALILGS